ncbi:MAG: hypothetical protein Q9222_003992 [Ikaeria aurantiellina]
MIVSLHDLPIANLSARALPLPPKFRSLPSIAYQSINDTESSVGGCYRPTHGVRVISPQDVLIALGMLSTAMGTDFYRIRGWHAPVLLVEHGGAAISIIKVATGQDLFSIYDAAVRVIEILWQCIIFSPDGLGGALAIGQVGNVFRVVVQTPAQ